MSGDTVPVGPGAAAIDEASWTRRVQARALLDRHWRPLGYTVPNAAVYPHQWLWDSCFHAVVWAHLGEPGRAVAELRSVLANQTADGFVPHMSYWEQPTMHEAFWGRPLTSSITQPPMYGHAVAELVRLGVEVDDVTVQRAIDGLAFLVGPRRGTRALVPIVHPWESGCDDSPRWARWAGADPSQSGWKARKGDLVASIACSPDGSSVANPSFEVEAAAFNALVVFNACELVEAGFADRLPFEIEPLRAALDARWDDTGATWRDDPDPVDGPIPRTLEALLPVLTSTRADVVEAVFAQVRDVAAFGGTCGPAQVHRDEPAFDPLAYWRGPAWPQLTYLFWLAARRQARPDDADWLADALVRGADRSAFAEYWHPDSGEGLGAVPQSWAALAVVVRR